jgi:small GTP-binding protein
MVEQELRFKVVLVGTSGVGKTSLLDSYVNKKFCQKMKPTTGARVQAWKVELPAV